MVEHKHTRTFHGVRVDALPETDAMQLVDVLYARRPANNMRHVSRIVGYYSNIANWNPSKVAELADRHKGDYAVTGASAVVVELG